MVCVHVCVCAAQCHVLPLAICTCCSLPLNHTGRTWRATWRLPTQHGYLAELCLSSETHAHRHVFFTFIFRSYEQQMLLSECARMHFSLFTKPANIFTLFTVGFCLRQVPCWFIQVTVALQCYDENFIHLSGPMHRSLDCHRSFWSKFYTSRWEWKFAQIGGETQVTLMHNQWLLHINT